MITQVLLLALAATAFARPNSSATVSMVADELCPPDLRHFLLPHEYDCTKFYYCEYGKRWLTPTNCAPGTEFSFEIQVCVHPSSAGCTLPGVPPTDAPDTEGPDTEAPETEAPEIEAPETEAPKTEAPETEAPETEAPETEAPETEAPETEAPETEAPETEAPETEAPETEAPETEAPETEAPETEAPETEAPETEAPETEAPETEAPETEAPETEAPETEAPETEAPATETPETEAPETEAPETEAPETEAPETEAPSTTVTTTTAAPSSTTAAPETELPTTEAITTEETTTTVKPETAEPTTTKEPTTTVAPSSIIPGIVSSPHTTSAPSSTEASILSSPHTTAAPTTAAPVEGVTAPEDTEWLDNGCPASWDLHWLLPHEEDCSKFYYCVFGEKVERSCPPTTYFNPALQVCDHAWNVECASNNGSNEASGEEGNSNEGSGEEGNSSEGSGEEANSNEASGNGEDEDNETDSEDNEVELLDNGCPADWNVHWLLPHESDCGKFYYCVHGQKVERECREPLHFNPTLQVCDWAKNAGCESGANGESDSNEEDNDNNSGDNNVETGGEDGNNSEENNVEWQDNGCPADWNVHWLLPHESDCGKFYYCVHGQKVERECREPLHFNPTLQVCDWAENAGCANGNNGDNDSNGDEDDNTDGGNSGEDDNTAGGDSGGDDNTAGGDSDNNSSEDDGNNNGEEDNNSGDANNSVEGSNEVELLDNGCPADFNTHWLLPHESDCSKFYYCVQGQKVERECSPPLHFNPTIQVCDWAANVGCTSGSNEEDSDNNGEDDNTDGGNGEDGNTEDGNGENNGEDNSNESNEEWLNNGCPADFNTHWLLPHESDCSKFYYCVQGQKVERECSPPLHFNPTIQVCDWANNAGCINGGDNNTSGEDDNNNNGNTEEEDNNNGGDDNNAGNSGEDSNNVETSEENNNKNSGESNEVEFLENGCPADFNTHWLVPHESDCGKFYYCVFGEKVERECREPLHFNPTLQVCDWVENAGCKNKEDSNNSEENNNNNGENSEEGNNNNSEDSNTSGEDNNTSGEDNNISGEDNNASGEGDNNNGEDSNTSGEGDNNNNSNEIATEIEPDHNKCELSCNTLPWAHETACDKFWRCEGSEAVLVICSEGLHFNDNTGTCDFICNANCVRDNVQTTSDQQGLKIFVPWNKVSKGWRASY